MVAKETLLPVTVVVHTYQRPDFLEKDVAEGRWDGIPLLLSDDASSVEVQDRLKTLTGRIGAGFVAMPQNGGPARAAHAGVLAVETPHFVLCGDDDYLKSFAEFAEEASRLIEDDDVLMVAMPEVRFVVPGKPQSVQYDRRPFDGMTGLALLRELVFGGEMRALQAGTVLRRDEALPHFASSLFRTSEDFILICRLCTEKPDAVVRVPSTGSYMRREHEASLSHRKNMSTSRAITNLLALLVGGRLLQTQQDLKDDVLLGLLRQRASVINTVYGSGQDTMSVLEALLTNEAPPTETAEAQETMAFLLDNQAALPRELVALKSRLATFAHSDNDGTEDPEAVFEMALEALDTERFEDAERLLNGIKEADLKTPAGLSIALARVAWANTDPNAAVRHLSRSLVLDPENADAINMLAQIARAAGEQSAADRLENRLMGLLTTEDAEKLSLVHREGVPDLRVAFIVSMGLDQFLDDIIRELVPFMDARKFVVKEQQDIENALSWADVCWFEWCNDPLVWASRQDIARKKAVICRLHRYEAFTQFPLRVQWESVDSLVVVAEHLAEILHDAIPGLHERTSVRHIPNGVDMSRYELVERQPGFNLALIGYLHGRKNPQMALQIMRELVDQDDRYQLHVAGKFQDPALQMYWSHAVKQLGLSDHVIMYQWQDDIAAFLADKSYILSTSIHESFGYSIAEAMARGIKPIVHHFPFAEEIWPTEILFQTVAEAAEMIQSPDYQSANYRSFIQNHYSLEGQVNQIRNLIESVARANSVSDKPLEVREIVAISPAMANAVLTCRCPTCRAQVTMQQQTILGHPVARERCNSCGATLQAGPSAYDDALRRYKEGLLIGSQSERAMETRKIAANWARHPVWSEVMTVDGINLGACMEFDITPELVQAWLKLGSSEVSA